VVGGGLVVGGGWAWAWTAHKGCVEDRIGRLQGGSTGQDMRIAGSIKGQDRRIAGRIQGKGLDSSREDRRDRIGRLRRLPSHDAVVSPHLTQGFPLT
jgi:hypothetical protein